MMKTYKLWFLVNSVWEEQDSVAAKNRKEAANILREKKYREGTWKLRKG